MEKDDTNYPGGFLEFNGDHEHLHQQQQHQQQQQQQQQQFMVKNTYENNGNQMVDYLINNPIQHLPSSAAATGFCSPNSFDKLSFADVMQFADLGPKLALNQNKLTSYRDPNDQEDQETGIDPIYFLKFPVLNERIQEDHHHNDQSLLPPLGDDENVVIEGGERSREEEEARVSEGNNNNNMSVRLQFIGDQDVHKTLVSEGKNKRKRPRTIKTSEEVESQRMTHIAVERNRRKQMNEHLRVLRSLMPGSYVQRGDQASIIGGAIEFVRELEQLLQCLESQKRRKLYGDNTPRVVGDSSSLPIMQQAQVQGGPAVFYPPAPDDEMKLVEYEGGLKEETAESKSCLADVEVRVLGFDAMIKILCRRRPGQLIKTIAALEDLQFNILHTNITTIEQTVLYSFNIKVASEVRFSAEDIANSVQQIISFVHENSSTN